jgi:hypothetical protein
MSVDVVDAHGEVTSMAENLWHKMLRSTPGEDASRVLKGLDSISQELAQEQASDNLNVLKAGLGEDVQSASAAVVPLGPPATRFGVTIDVRVTDLLKLNDHIGDLFDGLSTGLTGGVGSVIEGLAIRVADDQGRRLGSWSLPRIGDGTLFIDRALDASRGRLVTLPFASRTGGPQLLGSATGFSTAARDSRPIATFTVAGRSKSYRASYVDCGKPGCPTGRGADRSRPLTVLRGRSIRVTLQNRASDVSARLANPTKTLSVKRIDARHWHVRIPRGATGRELDLNMDFAARPDASWGIALKYRRRR